MKKEQSNEPAFASVSISQNDSWRQEGLTKREYFVAMAMQGILASSSHRCENYIVEQTFLIADAILEKL